MKRKKPNKIKVVGYARVSGWAQADHGISLEHQQDTIRKYCEVNGLELVELLVEAGRSAYKQTLASRETGARVVELVESGQVGAVAALRLDRLFRSQTDCLTTVVGWDRRGVSLRLIDFGGSPVDTGSPLGRLVIVALATMGELESEAKSERMKDCWAHVRKQGRILGSNPPFGYSVGKGNELKPNQDEQTTVAIIRSLRATGKSYRQIVDKLTQEGRRPRGSKWNLTTVVRILKNNPI